MTQAAENAIVEKLARTVFEGMDPSWAEAAIAISFASRASEVNAWWRLSPHGAWQPTGIYNFVIMDLAELFWDLRQLMYREGSGTWFSARLTVGAQGEYRADYDYETQPAFERPIDPALFIEDLEKFPRDQSRVPDWVEGA